MSQELQEKINSLEAALYISREGERIAKERLSAVSEELVAAHQETDKWRALISLPLSTGSDLAGGWTIATDFLGEIQDSLDGTVGLEEIEDVLLAFNKLKSREMLGA